MITTTTPTLEGRKITAYLGVVAAEVAVNTNIFKEFFTAVTRMVGERTETPPENRLKTAREDVMRALEDRAAVLGADAVVDLQVRFIQGNELTLIVSATGTAVKIE